MNERIGGMVRRSSDDQIGIKNRSDAREKQNWQEAKCRAVNARKTKMTEREISKKFIEKNGLSAEWMTKSVNSLRRRAVLYRKQTKKICEQVGVERKK